MKLKSLYSLLLATTLVACTDDYTDWAAPQQNAPETPQSVSFTATAAPAINFADVTTDSITVITPTLTAEEGVTATYKLTLDGSQTLNVDSKGQVLAADLNAAVVSLYGKRPVERTMVGTVVAYADVNGQVVKSELATALEVKVTLDAPQISKHYYIIGAPAGDVWNPTETSLMFNHSGKDVYEDPVFTVMFPVEDGETWFAISDDIAVEKNDWAYVFGCAEGNGNNGMEGSLARRSELDDDGSWKIVVNGDAAFVRVTLNMMDYTYTIKKVISEYYIVGAMQGWKGDAVNKTCMLYPNKNMTYSYTTKFEGDANLKIWLGSDFGNWDACYGAIEDGDSSASGTLVSTSAGAAKCPEPGTFYTFTANFHTMTYTWTRLENQDPVSYTNISLIGDFNNWTLDTSIDLREVTPHNWYIGAVDLSGGEMKLCADKDWGDSWGVEVKDNIGEQNLLIYNGQNFLAPVGTYDVFFNDITGECVFKIVE